MITSTQRASEPFRSSPVRVRWVFFIVSILTLAGYLVLARWNPAGGFRGQLGHGPGVLFTQPGFRFLVGLIVLADLYPAAPWLSENHRMRPYSWSSVLSAAAIIAYGPWAALVFLLSGLLQALPRRGRHWWPVALSTAVVGCEGVIAAYACSAVRTAAGPSDGRLLAVGFVIAAVMVATRLAVSAAMVTAPGKRRRVARGVLIWGLSLVVAPVAAVTAGSHPWLLPLLGMAIIALHHASDSFAERVEQAHTDALTGLANRSALMERLDRRRGYETDEQVTVLVIDLDGFKAVNDRFGHVLGDEVLTTVAGRLTQIAHDQFVARYGGDEFVVVVSGCEPEGTRELARSIDLSIRQPMTIGGQELRMTASVGIASSGAVGAPMAAAELIAAADRSMYRRKFRAARRRLPPKFLLGPRIPVQADARNEIAGRDRSTSR